MAFKRRILSAPWPSNLKEVGEKIWLQSVGPSTLWSKSNQIDRKSGDSSEEIRIGGGARTTISLLMAQLSLVKAKTILKARSNPIPSFYYLTTAAYSEATTLK